jgi:hypothetical protein
MNSALSALLACCETHEGNLPLLVGRGGRRRHKCQPLLPYEYKA